jgi:hypothetical protein
VQEDSIDDVDDMVLPKREDYKEQLMKYEDKDPGSLTILNQGNEGTLHLCEDDWKNIALIKSHPPTLDQGKDTQEDKGMVDLKVRKERFSTRKTSTYVGQEKGKAKYVQGV